jgi:hypothetical protein
MDTGTTDKDVAVEVVTRALRRVRPGVYRVDHLTDRTTVTLTVSASAGGRRNAAARVISALTAGGLELIADDPVTALANEDRHLVVRHAG